MPAMKLSALYASMTSAERDALAKKADEMSPAYLYQIATRWDGRRPSLPMLAKLAAADARLTLDDMVAEFAPDKREAV